MQITAAVARLGEEAFEVQELELEAPRPNEVLIRIAGVGICHTDLIARDQHLPVELPAVLGHEGAGIVEKVGENVTHLRAGDSVVMTFLSCGDCARCTQHAPAYCHNFAPLNFTGVRNDGSTALEGAQGKVSGRFFGQSSFANYALAQERNVVKVDSSKVALETLGPLGCGFLTGAGSIMRALACEPDSSLGIFGAGAVGQAAVLGAVIQGCNPIIVVEPQAKRRALALELGATHALDPADGDITEAIVSIAPQGLSYAFDTSGIQSVLESALACLGPSGTLGVVAAETPETSLPVNLTGLVIGGQKIIGILEGSADPQELIPELVRLYAENRFPLDKLIQTFPLDQINEAIAAQHRGDCVKAVLIP